MDGFPAKPGGQLGMTMVAGAGGMNVEHAARATGLTEDNLLMLHSYSG